MPKHIEIEKIADSLATISDIIFKRFQCMECNQCEPGGRIFMNALKTLREMGHIETAPGQTNTPKGQ